MSGVGKVSIVIPCYNQGLMLREALISIERVRNINLLEVIIVNDGSSDPETCEIFHGLKNTSYIVVNQSNMGLGAARNVGIRIAGGEFILPLDSDNRIRDAYLTIGVERLTKEKDIGVVYGDAEFFGQKAGRWHVPEFNLFDLALGNYIDACALYRKSAWESVSGYDEKMPYMGWEDWDFWLRICLKGWQFTSLNAIAFDYRISDNSMLKRETNNHEDELISYIFNKKENSFFSLLRGRELEFKKLESEIARLKLVEKSKDYRLGRFVLKPLRSIKRIVGCAAT